MRKVHQKQKGIQKFKETGDSRYIYQNELDKVCFQHDMTYQDFSRGTASDKILRDKTFNISKSINYGGYQRDLASMFYKFFDKKTSGGTIMQNQKIKEKLHKTIIRKFGKRKLYSSFKDNIWSADIVDM